MQQPPSLREWLCVDEAFDIAMNPSFLGVFAHLGCLGALQREELLLRVSGLAGASAGSQAAAFFASGKRVLHDSSELALHNDMETLTNVGERRWQILDPGLGLGLLKGDGFEAEMSKILAPTFENLVKPFACTAWSMRTGMEILDTGSVPRAVRASCTVPGLFQPCSHNEKSWLFDGGIPDPSGSLALRALPTQPHRALHVIVERRMMPPLDSRWIQVVPPSKFGAKRREVVTVRLRRPPALFLDASSFQSFDKAVLSTASAVLAALDQPMRPGLEQGHWILDVDVAWNTSPQSKL